MDIGRALDSWKDLNLVLKTAGEDLCSRLLESERTGPRRRQFMFRIHSRFNRVRAIRERREIEELLGENE